MRIKSYKKMVVGGSVTTVQKSGQVPNDVIAGKVSMMNNFAKNPNRSHI